MNDLICGYKLDNEQSSIVLDESKYLLVTAGAGSGKTLTILGKINYLIKYKGVKFDEILCISFTNKACDSLRNKIKESFGYDMDVYTFHRLSLDILKHNNFDYKICDSLMLEHIINDFFLYDIANSDRFMKYILNYFDFSYGKDIITSYRRFCSVNYKELELFKKNIASFLRLFKCNNFGLEDFVLFGKRLKFSFFSSNYKKEKIFLIIALNVYMKYQDYLVSNKEIDFDDMISYATSCVKENGFKRNIRYIIIDEYQDTSYVRFSLIKSILSCTDASLLVVGDDFQSIYRFTGCDLGLFLDFDKYFKDAKVMKIQTTYRNSQELIDVAGKFIMKNKRQIKKKLVSNRHIESPIKIYYYKDIKKDFKKLVLEVYNKSFKPIMILGRNNFDINNFLDSDFKLLDDGRIVYLKNTDIYLYYMTAHKSKGLEEENVIIINLDDSYLGFPSKIVNDKVFRFVCNSFEKIIYSEERRLFYVALTRTKNYVYLFSSHDKPSIFVKEIERYIGK